MKSIPLIETKCPSQISEASRIGYIVSNRLDPLAYKTHNVACQRSSVERDKAKLCHLELVEFNGKAHQTYLVLPFIFKT